MKGRDDSGAGAAGKAWHRVRHTRPLASTFRAVLASAAMATQEERSAASLAKLMDAARPLFRTQGYAATSVDDITRAALLTKGAFYHHFTDKKAIFHAVFEEAEHQLQADIRAACAADDAWTMLKSGCLAFLDITLDPGVQRLLLREGPSVLGWDVWRDICARHSLGVISGGIRAAIKAGQIRPRPTEPLAATIYGALTEAARYLAELDDPAAALPGIRSEIELMLEALRAQPKDSSAA
jgi:AcrR family transcriptional regulator